MEFRINAVYNGDGRVELTHAATGNKLVTDLPPDNGGKGRGFSPTDLAAAAVASCVLTIMAKMAEREGVDLAGASFEIEKHMAAEPRRIGKLTGVITLPAGLGAETREKLKACVKACPVSRSLRQDLALDFEFR